MRQGAAKTVAFGSSMTLDEWAALDEDVSGELVDGVLEEEEMPSFLHEIVVAWLIRVLWSWARKRKGHVAGSETKIAVAPRRGRKPDVSVFLPPAIPALGDALVRVPPYIVVEVVSPRPRDARRDRVAKLRDYARARIAFYWLIDPALRSVEILELGRDGRYVHALGASDETVARVPGCPRLKLAFAELWAGIDEVARTSKRSRPRRG
jgi:Uma2 family endonuclease